MDIDQDVSTAVPSSYHIETFDQTGHGPRRPNMMGGYGHRPPGPSGGAPVKICYDFFSRCYSAVRGLDSVLTLSVDR